MHLSNALSAKFLGLSAACSILGACASGAANDGATPAPSATTSAASTTTATANATPPAAGSTVPMADPADAFARVTTAVIVPGITSAWAVDGAVLVVAEADGTRKLARLDADHLVDEAALSRGLPVVASQGTMGGGRVADFVGGVLGRYPDSLLLGVTRPVGFGSTTSLRYDPALGWTVIASKPDMGLVADPALSLGIGALFADVNFVGDAATSPTHLLIPGATGYPVDVFASAKPLRTCFDHSGGGVFLVRGSKGVDVWTLTDDAESARGVLRKNDVVAVTKTDVAGALREPLFVRSSGQVLAGFVESAAVESVLGGSRVAACDGGACVVLDPLPARLAEIRELGGTILALAGDGIAPGAGGSGDVFAYDDHVWRRVAMPATHPRAAHFLTSDDGSSTLLVIAEGTDRTSAIVRLHAR